jgi:outer membrane immunogenic protein
MIKKLLISSAAATAMLGSAYAADLPSRKAPLEAPVPPVFTWTGAYVGVNGGGAWTRAHTLPYVETAGGAFFFAGEFGPLQSRTGGFGGAQAGINYQTGMFVFGAELDFQGASLRSSAFNTFTPYLTAGNSISIGTTQRIDYFGTARGRLGVAFGPALIYATGGLAYAGVRDAFFMTDTFGFTAANSNSNARMGFAAGGGVEWMFAPNWSIKGEYLYVGLRQGPRAVAVEFVGAAATTFAINHVAPSIGMHTARLGVNYHFGSPPAPVVARY